MPTTIETRIRRELDRAAAQIEGIRLRVGSLSPAQRARRAEAVEALEAILDRAGRAIDRLSVSTGVQAEHASRDFHDAWTELKTRMRGVLDEA